MAHIYKIINNINQKIYIGKTNGSLQKRFNEHIRDHKKERCEKRPLYNAMNFYGVENFSIEQIEECPIEQSAEREIYWISFYGTYSGEGYNATQGGDGKHYADYDLIVKEYLESGVIRKVVEKTGYAEETIRTALISKGIKITSHEEYSKINLSKKINMLDLEGNFIKEWISIKDAARWIRSLSPRNNLISEDKDVKGIATHIINVCKGTRKTAYKYKWKYS